MSKWFRLYLLFCFVQMSFFLLLPWYNCTGWLGIKHQVTYFFPLFFPLLFCVLFLFYSSLITPHFDHLCSVSLDFLAAVIPYILWSVELVGFILMFWGGVGGGHYFSCVTFSFWGVLFKKNTRYCCYITTHNFVCVPVCFQFFVLIVCLFACQFSELCYYYFLFSMSDM